MDLRDRQDLYNGFGDGLARAFELAVTPAVFGAMGYALDRWLGVLPLFTLLLSIVAVCGTFYMMWFRYEAEMKQEEQRRAEQAPSTGGRRIHSRAVQG